MAVALLNSVEVQRTGTTDPQTWTHVPGGTPSAIVVAIIHGTSTTDHASTVTYGGVSMSRIVRATDSATELGAAELWFLGASIPTGNQTVSVDLSSATTDDIHFVSMSFSANSDCEVLDFDSINDNVANPSVTLQYTGRSALAVAALYTGLATPVPADFTPNANCTAVQDFDIGAFGSAVFAQTTAGTSDFAIGGTSVSDDVAFVALAITEVRQAITIAPLLGSLAIAGLSVGVAFTGPDQGALRLTGLAPTVSVVQGTAIDIPVGSLIYSGQAPLNALAFNVQTPAGAMTFSSAAPERLIDTPRAVPAGSLLIAGHAPTVSIASAASIAIPAGAIAVGGRDVGVAFTGPGVARLTFTGYAPSIDVSTGVSIPMPVGALTCTGYASALGAGVGVPAGVVAFSGLAATLGGSVAILNPAGSEVFSGHAPLVAIDHPIAIPAGTWAYSGQYVAVRFIDAPAGQLVFTGLAPTAQVTQQNTPTPGVGAMAFTSSAPALLTSVAIPAGSLVVTGQALTDVADTPIAIPAGTLRVTGLAPAAAADYVAALPAGALAWHGSAATLGGQTNLTIPAGVLTLAGSVAVLERTIPIAAGQLAIQGRDPSFSLSIGVPCGALRWTGRALEITAFGAPGTATVSIDTATATLATDAAAATLSTNAATAALAHDNLE